MTQEMAPEKRQLENFLLQEQLPTLDNNECHDRKDSLNERHVLTKSIQRHRIVDRAEKSHRRVESRRDQNLV